MWAGADTSRQVYTQLCLYTTLLRLQPREILGAGRDSHPYSSRTWKYALKKALRIPSKMGASHSCALTVSSSRTASLFGSFSRYSRRGSSAQLLDSCQYAMSHSFLHKVDCLRRFSRPLIGWLYHLNSAFRIRPPSSSGSYINCTGHCIFRFSRTQSTHL